jgi:3-hydroxyacyl-[acyl-carrier-protein] dehydratase
MELEFDIQGILEMLPHRYPFLLVDRVLKLTPDDRIVALKNVTINEPFFQGHFPGKPVMPGVLIIEAMAQVGGILAYQTAPPEKRNRLIYFMGMDKVRFRKMVLPGDQIIFEAKILKFRSKVAKMSGTAMVDDQLVAEAELLASFGDTK